MTNKSTSIDEYNKKSSDLNQFLTKIRQNYIDLEKKLHTLFLAVDEIKEIGGWGYFHNGYQEAMDAISDLVTYLDSKNESKSYKKAELIASNLLKVTNTTKEEELRHLSDKFRKIKHFPKVADVIETSIDKVIDEVKMYGGKANKAFMGCTQATKLIGLFGTLQQKNQLNILKSTIKKREAETFKQFEENFIRELNQNIKTNKIQDKLSICRDAYNDYKLNNKSTNDRYNIIFDNEYRIKRSQALALHEKGTGALRDFVSKILLGNDLFWEEKDMFVRIYGTDNQIISWKSCELPSARAKENRISRPY